MMDLMQQANLGKVSALAAEYGEYAAEVGLSDNPCKHAELGNVCAGLPAGDPVRNAVFDGFKAGYSRKKVTA